MKYLASTIVFWSIVTSSLAQKTQASWSHELKVGGYERIIALVDDHTIVQRSRRDHFEERDYESELARYDADGKVTHIIPVDELEKQDFQEIAAFNTDIGIAVVYLTTDTRSEKHFLISAQLYDHSTLAPKEIVDLMSIRYRRPDKPSIKDYTSRASVIDIDYELSEDLSTLAIYYSEEQIGKDDYTMVQYAVYDLQNGLQELNTGIVETEFESNKYLIADYAVDNQGNTAILMKEYEDNRGLEFVDRRPSYKYAIYYEGKDSTNFIYDLPRSKYFIDAMMAALDNTGNVYVGGMIRKKPANDVYGTVLTKITNTGVLAYHKLDTYTSSEVKKIRQKDKEDIESEYDIVDLRITEAVVYGVYQYSSIRYDRDINNTALRGTAFGSPMANQRFDFREYYYKENVVVHGFTAASGERAWTAVNSRRQSDFNIFEYWTYGNIHLVGDDLVMLYNERTSNLERLRENKNPRNIDFPERKTFVNMVRISPAGIQESFGLSEQAFFYIPYEGSLVANGQLVLLRVRRDLNAFFVGRYGL